MVKYEMRTNLLKNFYLNNLCHCLIVGPPSGIASSIFHWIRLDDRVLRQHSCANVPCHLTVQPIVSLRCSPEATMKKPLGYDISRRRGRNERKWSLVERENKRRRKVLDLGKKTVPHAPPRGRISRWRWRGKDQGRR